MSSLPDPEVTIVVSSTGSNSVHPDQNLIRTQGLKHKELFFNVFEKYQAVGARVQHSRSSPTPHVPHFSRVDMLADMLQVPGILVNGNDSQNDMINDPYFDIHYAPRTSKSRKKQVKRKQRQNIEDILTDAIRGIGSYYSNKSSKTSGMNKAIRASMLAECDKVMEEMGVPTDDAVTVYLWLRNEKDVLRDFTRLSVEKRWNIIHRIVNGRI